MTKTLAAGALAAATYALMIGATVLAGCADGSRELEVTPAATTAPTSTSSTVVELLFPLDPVPETAPTTSTLIDVRCPDGC